MPAPHANAIIYYNYNLNFNNDMPKGINHYMSRYVATKNSYEWTNVLLEG